MITHHKLKLYRKALECAGSAERLSSGWARKHSFVDHFCRASESMVLNIAEGARLLSGPAKLMTLDYAIGSALECAACLDIAEIKDLLRAPDATAEKHRLWEITRMLIGLRKSWCHDAMNEEPTPCQARGSVPEPGQAGPLFHHRRHSSQEFPSGRQIHAGGRNLLLAKIKIGRALDRRCGRHLKESTMVQLRIPTIAFCNVQQEARCGFVELPIGPITQFLGAGQGIA